MKSVSFKNRWRTVAFALSGTIMLAATSCRNDGKQAEEEVPSYRVTFNSKGGAPTPPAQTVVKGEKVAKPDDPAKSDDFFEGWTKVDNATSALWDFDTETVADDIMLYARWESDAIKNLRGNVIITPGSISELGYDLAASYSGSEAVTFQWEKDGAAISGATGAKYQPAEIGWYSVSAGAVGFVTKRSVEVEIIEKIPPYQGGSGQYTRLVWRDEFNGSGLPDLAKWNFHHSGIPSNQEMQYYPAGRAENTVQRDGYLVLTARNDKAMINGQVREVTSGYINTRFKGDWKYGRIEVRARVPVCLGTWPAIWMMPTNEVYGGWPKSGEIDIMEHVGHNQYRFYFNVHTEKYNHMHGNDRGTSVISLSPTSFHVFAIEWFEDRIDWYFNDRRVHRVQNDRTGWESWPLDQRFYLILNLAFGGTWGGSQGVNLGALPQEFLIDYVRVYQ